jgi:hypothetical protein
MTMHALATPAPTATPALRLLDARLPDGGTTQPAPTWWERRSMMRSVVGGCPDHWWKPTAPRTAACTCDRFAD